MKFFLSNASFSILTVVLPFSFMVNQVPQDPPGKKEKRHIKIVKIDDEGNKTELDTLDENNGIFVWNGDTIDNEEGFDFDFDFNVDGKNAHAFVFKFKDLDSLKQFQAKIEKDVEKAFHDMRIWEDKDGTALMLPRPPHPPPPPHMPKMLQFEKIKAENNIDLSDPGIISYKRKDKSGGREKITIIREKPEEREKLHEEIIITGRGAGDAHFLRKPPSGMHEMEVIEKDGKIIKIRKHRDDNKNEMEAEVEVIKEKEPSENENN